jgi:hypothetical protein
MIGDARDHHQLHRHHRDASQSTTCRTTPLGQGTNRAKITITNPPTKNHLPLTNLPMKIPTLKGWQKWPRFDPGYMSRDFNPWSAGQGRQQGRFASSCLVRSEVTASDRLVFSSAIRTGMLSAGGRNDRGMVVR